MSIGKISPTYNLGMKIGVIDSGVGGLTTLSEIIKECGDNEYIYLADDADLPFGTKSCAELVSIGKRCVAYLEGVGCNIIVFACNTLTAAVKGIADGNFRAKIIGAEPAVKPALLECEKVAILATTLTANSSRLKNLINGARDRVDVFACDDLVEYIERTAPCFDGLEKYLYNNYDFLRKYDGVVMGCTHFIFAEKYINLNIQNIKCFDGNRGIARQTARFLQKNDEICNNLNYTKIITFSGGNVRKYENTLEYLRH